MRGVGDLDERSCADRRTSIAPVAARVLASIVALALVGCGGSSDTADKRATHAYLQAAYSYEQMAMTNIPAVHTAAIRFANKLGSECPGVMAGTEDMQGSSRSFARQVGESRREEEQSGELEEEIGLAEREALERPDRQALSTFANAVRQLHWSNPELTRQILSEVAELQTQAEQPIPDVCADIKAWVSSGYKTLPHTTKKFRVKRDEEAKQSQQTVPTRSTASLLSSYEGPSEKRLISETQALRKQARNDRRALTSVYERLLRRLGLQRRGNASPEGPPADSLVIGHGITAAGERFLARLEPKEPRSSSNGSGCLLPLSITGSGAGSLGTCMSRSPRRSPSRSSEPSVDCASARLTVTVNTLPAARSVRLSLSNGQQITSRVLFVPASRGGPAGYYYQVVRGPSPIPVSLTELDVHGVTLQTITLPHIVECTKNPIKYLPGGVQTLVHEKVPNGPPFSITGERYRFLGRVYFELKIHVEEPTGSSGAVSLAFGHRPSMLDWRTETGCHPHPYAILYSLLTAPGDTVFIGTPGKLTEMQRVAIPAIFNAGGVLVYSTSIVPSSELVIRTKSGKTIRTEKIGSIASEAEETCRGEEEGAARGRPNR
jgi:hypothetical protein